MSIQGREHVAILEVEKGLWERGCYPARTIIGHGQCFIRTQKKENACFIVFHLVTSIQGGAEDSAKFCQNQPTKSDVTSG